MSTEIETIEGGCLCGSIRYEFDGAPLVVAVCHCRHCQKQGGSAFSINVVVPVEAYRQNGDTTMFEDVGDSGHMVVRHFCGRCGSPIHSAAAAMPQFAIIKAGTLDDPAPFTPTQEAYCDTAMPWMPSVPSAERFPRSNV